MRVAAVSVALAAALCAACVLQTAHAAGVNMPTFGFWAWEEAIVDPELPLCQSSFEKFVSGDRTAPQLAGGHMFLSTNYMFICHNPNATRRFAALSDYMDTMLSKYGITVDLLFSQSSDSTIPTGAPRWLETAIPFAQKRVAAGHAMPAFRFDVEYTGTAADAERVLQLAYVVRQTINTNFPDASSRPELSWAVNTLAASSTSETLVTCPVNQETMVIADCFFLIVDSLTAMDYRSFAVQEPLKTACDGMVVRGAPFYAKAKAAGKRVALGAETSCNLGSPYQYKISFCAKGQLKHTSEPLLYMYSTLNETRSYLENTSMALQAFPCAGSEQAPVQPLEPGQSLWQPEVVADPAFVIEDSRYWEFLAYATTGIMDNCPVQDFSWQSCM